MCLQAEGHPGLPATPRHGEGLPQASRNQPGCHLDLRPLAARTGWALSARLPLFDWNWSPDSLVEGDRVGPQRRAPSKAT